VYGDGNHRVCVMAQAPITPAPGARRLHLARRIRVRRRNHRVCPSVQALTPCLRAVMQVTLELGQAATIDVTLEVDYVFQRNPVVVPTPGIELGMIGRTQ